MALGVPVGAGPGVEVVSGADAGVFVGGAGVGLAEVAALPQATPSTRRVALNANQSLCRGREGTFRFAGINFLENHLC